MKSPQMTHSTMAAAAAEMMIHDTDTKRWNTQCQAIIQIVHEQSSQTFSLLVYREPERKLVLCQQIYHNMKYQVANNNQFHQWRNEQRTVYGLHFHNEQEATEIHHAVRSAQDFLAKLINAEQSGGVYQEPQNNYYNGNGNGHHQNGHSNGHSNGHDGTNGYHRDTDADSVGSNGYRRHNGAVHPQLIGQSVPSSAAPQPQAPNAQTVQQQQQRRSSQGSSGSSTLSGNIYATAHLNGYAQNGHNPSSAATSVPNPQMAAAAAQPIRLANGHHGGATLNGHSANVPIRQAVPPPAPPPPPASTSAPPPPPPPPSMAGGLPPVGGAPPPPPPPPPSLGKSATAGGSGSMADMLANKANALRKVNEGENSGAMKTNGAAPKTPMNNGMAPDFLNELTNKFKKMNNQAEVVSVASAISTTSSVSTNSNDSDKPREPPPPKPWQKPATNGTMPIQNGTSSPKVQRKFSKSLTNNGAGDNEPVTKADLDRLRQDLFAELAAFKQELLDALVPKR